jgi:hypothetical protein
MSYIPALIPIYAANPADEVKRVPALLENAFGRSVLELSALPGFPADQEFVHSLKRSIEDDASRYQTADKALQVSECLKALMRLAMYEESPPSTVLLMIDTLGALLTAMYGGGWSPAQRSHFDFVADKLHAWHAYFLSYTNAGARVINDDYDTVIRKHTDPVVRKARDRDKDNMLADAIVNWFERHRVGRRSFYDKKKLEAGDLLKADIEPAVRNALAFIQLVHLDIFTGKGKSHVNWPFEEYKVFTDYNDSVLKGHAHYRVDFESRLIPVIAGDPAALKLPDHKLTHRDHRPWRDRLFDKALYLELPMNKSVFDKVMGDLESAVVHRAYRIIDNVP